MFMSLLYSIIIIIIVNIGCDHQLLGNGSQNNTSCDPPYNTLGFKGGIACYTNNIIGSTAFLYCLNCGFNSIRGSSVRKCLTDGSWNGTIPDCNCKLSI